MNFNPSRFPALACLILLACLISPNAAADEEIIVPKVDNFFICVDTSGSMMSEYHESGVTDLVRAKEVLRYMVKAIPDMDFNGGLYRVADFEEVLALEPFVRDKMGSKIGEIPDEVPIFGNVTPLGEGMFDMATPISKVPGPTAVILVTDGGQNKGEWPQPVVQQLYDKYDICLHIIGFANNEKEQRTLDELAAINPCTVMATGDDLLDPANMQSFVEQVFIGRKIIKSPPPPPVTFHSVTKSLDLEFDVDKFDIRPRYDPDLDAIGELMSKYTDTSALIMGYTDSTATYNYNLKLSAHRAEAVARYLTDRFGIAHDRLETVGYGKNFPVDSNLTDEGRQRNRRVDVRITGWFVEE